ncbi:hypothetical protein HELRODRAFT_164779 [Helobdella robusta]|uniref:BACK domain-containing protein n=1 Tax=Helobdella robusta TaxID=6412 RepID=T1EVT0_HELRO|nr:hypothetical protein HELRODRAFT_164779 [Helobdella robusta]ESN92690.1 hypothetical protein HELRODRAFT_164779 [Helobdella robusta]
MECCYVSKTLVLVSGTGGRFKVDRDLFHRISDYYQARVKSGMKDAHHTELTLDLLSDRCLAEVEEFMLKMQCNNKEIEEQSLENLEEAMHGALYLQVGDMIHQYISLLEKHITDSTWIRVLNIAKKCGADTLIAKFLDFVCENFTRFVQTSDMLTLSPNDLLHLLKSDLLDADSEIDVFKFVIKWISMEESRRPLAEKLLAEVRFSLMTTGEKQECSAMLSEMNLSHCQHERIAKARDTTEVMLIFKGLHGKIDGFHFRPIEHLEASERDTTWRDYPMDDVVVEVTSDKLDRYKAVDLPMKWCDYEVCIADRCLYVAGGSEFSFRSILYQLTSKVYVFSFAQSLWKQCSSMHLPRKSFYFCSMAEGLFAVSGKTKFNKLTSTVERYKPMVDEWQTVTPLPVAVCGPAGCVRKGRMYVSGGHTSSGDVSDSVWQFDPTCNTWSSVTPLLRARFNHTMASAGDKLIVVGGANAVRTFSFDHLMDGEMYDFEADQWSDFIKLEKPACSSPSILIGSSLYLFAGVMDLSGESLVQKINMSKYLNEKSSDESVVMERKKTLNENFEKCTAMEEVEEKRTISPDRKDYCEVSSFRFDGGCFRNMCVTKLPKKLFLQSL